MRTIETGDIIKNVKEMCIEANHFLSDDMRRVFEKAVSEEKSPLGKQVLNQLEENLEIAGADMIPICQDTGMAVLFVKVGQEVHIEGGSLTDASMRASARAMWTDFYANPWWEIPSNGLTQRTIPRR